MSEDQENSISSQPVHQPDIQEPKKRGPKPKHQVVKPEVEAPGNSPTKALELISDPKEVERYTPPELTIKEQNKRKMEMFRDEESRLVKGRFRCHETPGAFMIPIFVRKYPGIAPFKMNMTDGEVYEIPMYVARFLNGVDVTASENPRIGTCSVAEHGFLWDGKGAMPSAKPDGMGVPQPVVAITSYTRRYSFESLEFDTRTPSSMQLDAKPMNALVR